MAKEKVDTRQFQVSPHIIYSLIKAQAGTLAKGVLECIMNSVDAGAQAIDITLTGKKLVVTDDGRGFETRAEIEACFEVFGFEHKEGDRTYGSFGIGRAQLWSFCRTVWHTNSFRMDVDIRNRGLDYDLVEDVAPVKGLRIEAEFYEPMATSDILACERELKELAMYVDIPVTFNGTRISKDPSKQKWTHETDDAWVSLSNVSRTLTVYNLGVKVREYPAYQFGCGGLVVTRPGVRLSLNMARNDILLAECQVWRRIKPFLQNKTDEAVKRSTRLTEEQLSNLATRFLAGEVTYADIAGRKLIGDVRGGKWTLAEFFDRAWKSADTTVTYAPKNDAGPAAEESHRHGYCFVLDHKTLRRFGVNSLTDMMRQLKRVLSDHVEMVCRSATGEYLHKWSPRKDAKGLTVVEDWREACSRITEGYAELAHKDWTKRQQAAMSTLQYCNTHLVRMLQQTGAVDESLKPRHLRIGVSEVAHAWTDGQQLIWLNAKTLDTLERGAGGAMYLVSLLVHEYLHGEPSSGTHVHDEEFHERFHEAMLFYPTGAQWVLSPGELGANILGRYLRECAKRGVPIKARVVQHNDDVEGFVVAA